MSTVADIKLVIADDHEIFRDGFKLMLSKFPEIVLMGEASNGRELLELIEKENPDVILTDIKMPVMDGIEATKKLQSCILIKVSSVYQCMMMMN